MGKILTGTVTHSMDSKNRIRIPAKFKSELVANNEDLHFVQYSSGNIAIMTDSVLAKRFAALDDIDASDEEMLNRKRFLMSRVEDVEEDGQGRIKLPEMARKQIGADKDHTELICVGMGDFVEIWVLERYEAMMAGMTLKDTNRAIREKQNANKGV